MDIGYIGLGKMGLAQVERLVEKGWRVVAWNRSEEPRKKAKKVGAEVTETLAELCERLLQGLALSNKAKPFPPQRRLIWLMVPHAVVDDVLKELVPHLAKGDTVIDGGNSFYKHSMRRARELARRGIRFLDVGVSGGPSGARDGACLMVGGDKRVFGKHEQLFRDLSANPRCADVLENNSTTRARGVTGGLEGSYAYVGRSGAGHFVKMVHNGIEYGMMQAIAEGFSILRHADLPSSAKGFGRARRGLDAEQRRRGRFGLNVTQIAELYNKGSVIESRLTGWLAKAFREHGENLKDISGEVAHSGEGLWTVKTARALGVPVKAIKDSLDFRLKSKRNPSYAGQVVSALRNQFGGHDTRKAGNSKS